MCEAKQYGNCRNYGDNKTVDVIFMYRDNKGRTQPDETHQIGLCETHLQWLSEIHEGQTLEMRGENFSDAMHEDLFQHFGDKTRMYTLVRVESRVNNVKDDKFCLLNGRDVDTFRALIEKETNYPLNSANRITVREEGFFQTCTHYIYNDENGAYTFSPAVVEVVDIRGEMELKAMSKGLTIFYKPVPEGELRSISDAVQGYFPRIEEYPTIMTEYTCELIPNFIHAHFLKKQEAANRADFTQCCEFIDLEIDDNIIDWGKTRENSLHTEESLFDTVALLSEALSLDDNIEDNIEREIVLKILIDSGEISEDVLWVTYVTANHILYNSLEAKKNLRKNTKLVDLFVAQGLEKKLLALAIAGERLRMLSVKQRDHYDILETNAFVVEYLVPKYIKGSDVIYVFELHNLTALEYWNYYNNTTFYFGGGFGNGRDNNETFGKDTLIYDYLLTHTPAEASEKVHV
jgi:hypothetical protein